jgi:hypothetical protein
VVISTDGIGSCKSIYHTITTTTPLTTGLWFSPGTLVSSTNKTDRHDITEILWKVDLNTIKQTNKQTNKRSTVENENNVLPVARN